VTISPPRAVTSYKLVREFHAAAGGRVSPIPTTCVPAELRDLRQRILQEEVDELRAAVSANDLVAVADALADIVYVACGTAATYGIPFDEVFAEVHRSNMTKVASGGPVLRQDGKIAKGPHYEPPDVKRCLLEAGSITSEET
jgi:predicted HAD superfamily Cof-like phosphohydrolase